jgi:hypothetical protein
MELLRFEADAYCRLMSMIGQTLAHFEIAGNAAAHGIPGRLTLNKEVFETMGYSLREMRVLVNKLSLPMAQKHLDRMQSEFEEKNAASFSNDSLKRNLYELTTRVADELEQRLFLSVPLEQSALYLQIAPPFSEEVTTKFPKMTEDISEAAKCLSLDRPTASVFHLMRTMELAVQQFGSELSITLVTEKNWQVILDQINAAIRKLGAKEAKTKAYAQAASHLYNVKVAWRNEVMHPKQTYTFEEAKGIFDNVKTFIGDLATIL